MRIIVVVAAGVAAVATVPHRSYSIKQSIHTYTRTYEEKKNTQNLSHIRTYTLLKMSLYHRDPKFTLK